MKKRIIALLFALVICFSAVISASAASSHIFDEGGYLSYEEIAELDSMANRIENLYGYCVMFCIAENVDGSTYDYSEALYNSEADGVNGILITDNRGGEKYSIYLSGDAENVITEQIMDIIWDAYNSNETYFGGISSYYAAVETVLESAVSSSPVTSPVGESDRQEEPVTEFVPVERTLPLVVDNADLLTTEEENALCARLEMLAQEYQMELAVLTVPDLEGKTAEAYADDFYDYNGYGYGENDDGMLVLYKPGEAGNREIHITTHGRGLSAFNDVVCDNIIDSMIDDLKNENYASAFNTYADLGEKYLKPNVSFIWLLMCIVIGMLAGFIIIKSIAGKNKSVRMQTNATAYTRAGSMVVTGSVDNFIGRRVYSTPKPKRDDSDSSGGSQSHTSSSGRSHGGSGRSF